MREDSFSQIDRLVRAYNRNEYTVREIRALAIDLMPSGGAAEVIAKLPEEVVAAVRTLIAESAAYTDEDWESLIRIRGPEPTQDERLRYRQKLNEIRAYFSNWPTPRVNREIAVRRPGG